MYLIFRLADKIQALIHLMITAVFHLQSPTSFSPFNDWNLSILYPHLVADWKQSSDFDPLVSAPSSIKRSWVKTPSPWQVVRGASPRQEEVC